MAIWGLWKNENAKGEMKRPGFLAMCILRMDSVNINSLLFYPKIALSNFHARA